MRICLCILVLVFTIIATVATLVYHTTINSHLSFKPKQDHTEYINTQRSYRPPAPELPAPTAPATATPTTTTKP